MEAVFDAEKKLDRILSTYPVFLQAERKTGVKKTRLVAGVFGGLVLMGLLHFVAEAFTAIAIFAYPAAMTVTAIEADNKADDVHWMTYWMVLALLNTVEILSGGWIRAIVPFYIISKLVLCVWLFLPQTQGATVVYKRVLQPLVAFYRQSPLYMQAVDGIKKGADIISKGVSSGKASANVAKAAAVAVNAVNSAKNEVSKTIAETSGDSVDKKDE